LDFCSNYPPNKALTGGQEDEQGCQMVYFQTKDPYLGIFWKALEYTMLVYFVAIWNILQPFGVFHGHFDIFSDHFPILEHLS
jgi:hypothetical protein